MRRRIEIGILYSRQGSYALMSEACYTGAMNAIAQVNDDPALDIELVPVERDPKCSIDLYQPLCAEILRDTSARHVVGCMTSWSRKEVIPGLERAGGTLWYATPYEGFEASDHVVYTHACPNQHLLPLLHWAFDRYGRSAFLTGSNYIWGWEMNRVARDVITAAKGEVLGERYLPIGDTAIDHMIDEIRASRPNFIVNSLIGSSSYAFLRAYAELGRQDSYFRADTCPVLSCNLTECELEELGEAAEGLISAGPYFRGQVGWPDHPKQDFGSSLEASAFFAVYTLAGLLSRSPQAETAGLADLLASSEAAKAGIDAETHHTALPVLIAQVEGGKFDVLEKWPALAADPYLSRRSRVPYARWPNLTVVK